MTQERIDAAEAAVKSALAAVHDANQVYIKACSELGRAKVDFARENPHPWYGQQVYRIMGGGQVKTRSEHGRVCFKDIGDDDHGNPHIPPGSYYVLIADKRAAWLDDNWLIELL